MPAATVNGHTFDVSINRLSGKEHVHYDGDDVSSVRNLKGTATHEFVAEEEDGSVSYEVDTVNHAFSSEISVIRRNGVSVYP